MKLACAIFCCCTAILVLLPAAGAVWWRCDSKGAGMKTPLLVALEAGGQTTFEQTSSDSGARAGERSLGWSCCCRRLKAGARLERGNLTNATRGWEVDTAAVHGWRRRCRFFCWKEDLQPMFTVLLKTALLLLGREDCCWFRPGRWRLHCCRYWKWSNPAAATEELLSWIRTVEKESCWRGGL